MEANGKTRSTEGEWKGRSISRIRKKREAACGPTERERRSQRGKTKDEHRKKTKGGKKEMGGDYMRKNYRKKYSKKPTEQNRRSAKNGTGLTEKNGRMGKRHNEGEEGKS